MIDRAYANLQTDEELVKFMSEGHSWAFEMLYHRYSSRVLGYFYRMLGGDEEKAQDFLHDLFEKLIHNAKSFRTDAKFTTWLYSIAHNMCKNEYRRLSVRKILDRSCDPDTVSGPENAGSLEYRIDLQNLQHEIAIELRKCDIKQRTTFILRYQEQMSLKQISDIMDCSLGTTKSRLFYVTRRLAENLEELNPSQFKGEHYVQKEQTG